MKKMSAFVSVLGLAFASHAMAMSEFIVSSCTPEHPTPDYGYTIKVGRTVVSVPGEGFKRAYLAHVSQITIAGPRPLKTYKVKYIKADPNRPGSSPSFEGPGFKLQYSTNGNPEGGQYPAIMEIRNQGNDISEKLTCKLFMI